jgi:hypothetical protein
MCGRYDNLIAREAYKALYKAFRLPESNFPPRYNIRADRSDSDRPERPARWHP